MDAKRLEEIEALVQRRKLVGTEPVVTSEEGEWLLAEVRRLSQPIPDDAAKVLEEAKHHAEGLMDGKAWASLYTIEEAFALCETALRENERLKVTIADHLKGIDLLNEQHNLCLDEIIKLKAELVKLERIRELAAQFVYPENMSGPWEEMRDALAAASPAEPEGGEK